MSAPPVAASRMTSLRSALGRLLGYIDRNRGYYAVWLATTLAYVATFAAIPRLVGHAIALIDAGATAEGIGRAIAWLVLVTLGSAAVRFFSRTLVFNAAREIEYEIRNDIFGHLQKQPLSFYGRWRTGDIMSRCVNDINAVRLLLGVGLLNIVQTPILFVAVIANMLDINVKVALCVLIPYPLFILIARTFGRTVHHWSLATQEGLAALSNNLQETISGIAVVKAYAMEGAMAGRFESENQALYRNQVHRVMADASMPAIVMLLPALSTLIVLVVGGGEIAAGRMAKADFFTFVMYIYNLTFPTFIMGWVVALTQRGAASMQRIDELLSEQPTIADPPDVAEVGEVRGDIEFRNLTFRYPGSENRAPALVDIDLCIPEGSTLGVVGPVGSGKSTLASLIPHLHRVADGELLIGGQDVNRIPLASLRAAIAMVPQESFLFSMTLADNIAFGLADASADVVRRAAAGAQLDKDVVELPQGYDTVVGERGVMLSGGQRQRTALARALAVRPRILILDDVLSAVDAETEAGIQRELDRLFQGRTVVVVSSRVSAVRGADQIVVLDGGRIVERGTHGELQHRGGLYARLSTEQAEEDRRRGAAAAAEATG
jgi:ATP-binding cassette subfamily B multidrug efflux pump